MTRVLLKARGRSLLTSPSDYMDAGKWEGRLALGAPVAVHDLEGSRSGKAQEVTLAHPSGGVIKAVWKERRRDRDVRKGNIPLATNYLRERLAYEVSQIVGFCNIPATVIRRMEGRVGSMQKLVLNADTWRDSELEYEDVELREWQKLAVLDWIICSTDRHRGNWLICDGGHLKAIDNSLTFPEKTQWGMYRGYRSRPHWYVSENGDLELLDDVRRLLTPEAKRRCVVELMRFGVGLTGRAIFSSRWSQLVLTGALPPYVEEDKGFMREPPR